jgi:hypothetical protein
MKERPGLFKVCLEPGVWLAPWDGDPGRTLVFKTAKIFATKNLAKKALKAARKFRPFTLAEIIGGGDDD